MDHINYARRVHRRRSCTMSELLPIDANETSFAAFCGNQAERESAALYGIARSCGRQGVVILHDDLHFDGRLGELHGLRPGNYSVFSGNRPGAYGYDPLYGLDEAGVLDAVFYYESSGTAIPMLIQQREAVRDYLRIMQAQFLIRRAPFGASPYNLDLLIQLTRLPFSQLDARVLAYLPNNVASDLRGRLSAPGVQQSAWNAVSDYASLMQSAMWTPRDNWSAHSRRSIVSTVEENNVLSLRIPGSDERLLRAITAELGSLLRAGRPFLLICYGLHVQGCVAIENILFSNRSNCSVGVIAPSLETVAPLETTQRLVQMYDRVIVFPCSSAVEAEAFSAASGNYYRVIRPEQTGRQRRMFHIIPILNRNRTYQENEVRNVRPEELMAGSTMLSGRSLPVATLVDRIQL